MVRDATSPAAALAIARAQHQALATRAKPGDATSLSAAWQPVGPAQVLTPEFGLVTGRITALAVDPADLTGNTVYLGTTGGGVWKSTNAAGPAAQVTFVPLTDTLPVFSPSAGSGSVASLSIGALATSYSAATGSTLLAGTGDPNDATDSFYGEGILRSADGGATWTLASGSNDGVAGIHSFAGLAVAGIAFSTTTPTLAVAALSDAAEGDQLNAADNGSSVEGLYASTDGGQTWQIATVLDGAAIVQSPSTSSGNPGGIPATAVVWNPIRQRFFAALRWHGFYESLDGLAWTRLPAQPGTGLTLASCPSLRGSAVLPNPQCPLFRATLAVQPLTGDTFSLTVDASLNDQGLWQDICALAAPANGTATCASPEPTFSARLDSTPLEQGSGSAIIPQADYNLAIAAVPAASGTDTILYAGTFDLFRCSLAAGCTLRNTTNARNGCATPAGVAPAQHALAATSATGALFLGNDGGLWRSLDGVAESGSVCNLSDATHFDNLNAALGSLAEVVSFAQDPTDPATLLAGLGALGSAGTDATSQPWPQLSPGEGGTVAIDQLAPLNWYLSTGPGINIANCSRGSACTPADFLQTAIGAPQIAGDEALIDAPWLLDPALDTQLLLGTCRIWRGPAIGGSAWLPSDLLSGPFYAPLASGCGDTDLVVRSLAARGPASTNVAPPSLGSQVVYAGLAGVPGAGSPFGHLFTSASAQTDTAATVWTDAALGHVTNDSSNNQTFNPGSFDLSSIDVDPHDPAGRTVYATVLGFAGDGLDAPHLYGSTDGGAHWLNLTANLPNAPASSVIVDPNDANTLYIALDTGVYVTSAIASCASTNCWSILGTALPDSPVIGLEAAVSMPTGDGRTGELRAATYGRGIWQIPLLTAIAPQAPAITLNPAALSFPAQQVQTEGPSQTITVTNSGNATLTVTEIAATGDFSVADTCTGTPVAINATCTVAVSFAPAAAGTRTGVLTVYGDVPGGQATAQLSGIGTAPAAVVLTPLTLAFGAFDVGTTSPVQNITVSNLGGTQSAIQSIAPTGDFAVVQNTCGPSLAPQTGCTLSITFTPTAQGTRTGALTVVDDAGTQIANLSGTGTAPATDLLSTSALSFSPQQLGTTSAPQQVTLLNNGDDALILIAASVIGDFTVVNACGASLPGHSSCTFSVEYVPKTRGSESGTLTVADVARSQTVALNGLGLAPPGVSLSPSSLTFAALGVGLTSPTETLTLTNNGGVPLSLTSLTLTGDFAVAANTCAAALAPAAVCTLQIAFTPTVAGPRTGSVTLTDNAVNSPQTAALTGEAIDFTLTVAGPSAASIASGQTASYLLLLSSAANLPGNAVFTCSGVPVNASCTVSPSTTALGAPNGTTLTVALTTGESSSAALAHPAVLLCAAFLPLSLLLFTRTRRRTRIALLTLLLAAAGCATGRTIPGDTGNGSGGSGPNPIVTPSGTYALTVAASSAGFVRSVNLTLTVQ